MSRGFGRALLATTTATALLVVAGACGVPGSSRFEQINPPPELATTTTAATTTTRPLSSSTSAPSTSAPSTSAPSTSAATTTEAPTTSTNPVFSASLYFVTGRQLTPIIRQLASSAAQQVLTELADGVPAGEEYGGLTTAIPAGADLEVTTTSGLATVELPPTFLTETPPQDQTTAIAQIVLTLTARPGIGQVRFTSAGEPQEVLRANGSLTNSDDVVACEDYSILLAPGAAACG